MWTPTVNPLNPVSALLTGLLGSVHCVAMCGGVVGVLCAGMPVQLRTRPLRQLPLVLAYNAGRIASYTLAGLLAGGFGAVVGDVVPLRVGQIVLKAVAGLLMLGVGLHLLGLLPVFRRIERLGMPLWARVQPVARRFIPVRSPARAVALGLLWGAMPCGLVYAALGLALGAGSAAAGGLTMLAFGLGTLPTVATMGVLAGGLLQLLQRPNVRRAAAVLIGTFGILSLLVVIPQLGALRHPGPVAGSRHARCACH